MSACRLRKGTKTEITYIDVVGLNAVDNFFLLLLLLSSLPRHCLRLTNKNKHIHYNRIHNTVEHTNINHIILLSNILNELSIYYVYIHYLVCVMTSILLHACVNEHKIFK